MHGRPVKERRPSALPFSVKKLEHGDTLIVWKLDRLGCSLRDHQPCPEADRRRPAPRGRGRALERAPDDPLPGVCLLMS